MHQPTTPSSYAQQYELTSLAYVEPKEHTLLDKLTEYVNSKTALMADVLATALNESRKITVVGVLKEHLSEYCSSHNLQLDGIVIADRSRERRSNLVKMGPHGNIYKFFNIERPFPCWVIHRDTGEKELLIVVVPGRDYIRHTAELVQAKLIALAFAKYNDGILAEEAVAKLLRVYIYPNACDSIMKIMQLAEVLGDHAKGAVVVLGYAEQFCSLIQARTDSNWKVVADGRLANRLPTDEFSRYRVLERENVRVVFLSMRHTFWGDISYFLVKELIELGAKCILYGAKLGTLRAPKDIADAIYMPSRFAYTRESAEVVSLRTLKSCLTDESYANHGSHVSIPTIMMETKNRLDWLTRVDNYASIDNEIGQMARAVEECNQVHPADPPVQFGAVHFATDFLNVWQHTPQSDESMLSYTLDDLWKLKEKQADIIWQFLKRYQSAERPQLAATFDSPCGSMLYDDVRRRDLLFHQKLAGEIAAADNNVANLGAQLQKQCDHIDANTVKMLSKHLDRKGAEQLLEAFGNAGGTTDQLANALYEIGLKLLSARVRSYVQLTLATGEQVNTTASTNLPTSKPPQHSSRRADLTQGNPPTSVNHYGSGQQNNFFGATKFHNNG